MTESFTSHFRIPTSTRVGHVERRNGAWLASCFNRFDAAVRLWRARECVEAIAAEHGATVHHWETVQTSSKPIYVAYTYDEGFEA